MAHAQVDLLAHHGHRPLPGGLGAGLSSAALTIPVCVLVGEGLAWGMSRLERIELALRRERDRTEQLRELDEMKDRFLSTVSHELRTPITICRGHLEVLDDRADAQELRTVRELLVGELEGMGRVVEDLTTLARNLLVDHFRRSKQDRVTDSIDAGLREDDDALSLSDRLEDTRPSPDDRLASKETQKMVRAALARISPDLREAVILRDLQDMDYKEIAVVLRVPEGTVKSRINRGRMELARLLSRNKRQASNE